MSSLPIKSYKNLKKCNCVSDHSLSVRTVRCQRARSGSIPDGRILYYEGHREACCGWVLHSHIIYLLFNPIFYKYTEIKIKMGRKKQFIKIPSLANIKCQHCGKKSRRKVPEDSSPPYFDCDKCGKRTSTPVTSCCIICAFTNTKCVPSLVMEAKSKGLTFFNIQIYL